MEKQNVIVKLKKDLLFTLYKNVIYLKNGLNNFEIKKDLLNKYINYKCGNLECAAENNSLKNISDFENLNIKYQIQNDNYVVTVTKYENATYEFFVDDSDYSLTTNYNICNLVYQGNLEYCTQPVKISCVISFNNCGYKNIELLIPQNCEITCNLILNNINVF